MEEAIAGEHSFDVGSLSLLDDVHLKSKLSRISKSLNAEEEKYKQAKASPGLHVHADVFLL